jgi:uncharacterized membrane protein
MNNSYFKFRRKLRLTALQLTAIVILPLFVFALVVKVQEKQESENRVSKIVGTQNSQKENYILQTASRPITHNSESVGNSDSAK